MIRILVRALIGFALAAAAITVATMLTLLIIGGFEHLHTWRAIVHRASSSAAFLGWLYPGTLMMVIVFGAPTWLILRARKWTSFLAYALAGAVSALLALVIVFVVARLPFFRWHEFALWAGMCGTIGGVVFRAVAGPLLRPGVPAPRPSGD